MEQNLKSILDSQSLDSVPKLQAFARERLPLLGTKPDHLIGVGNHPINPALASIEETITVGIRHTRPWPTWKKSPKTLSKPFLSARLIRCQSASLLTISEAFTTSNLKWLTCGPWPWNKALKPERPTTAFMTSERLLEARRASPFQLRRLSGAF